MATLINAYITKAKLEQLLQQADKGVAFTIAVNDEANAYNQNVSLYLAQTKDQRESKTPKTYFGNGAVVWTDNKVTLAPKKDAAPAQTATQVSEQEWNDSLPF
jgi:hypothetical protein